MPSIQSLTRPLVLAAALVLASSCASKGPPLIAYPPAADLKVEPKPLLAIEALGSDNALSDHDAAVEAWGERGWATVARICRWAEANAAPRLNCPPAD